MKKRKGRKREEGGGKARTACKLMISFSSDSTDRSGLMIGTGREVGEVFRSDIAGPAQEERDDGNDDNWRHAKRKSQVLSSQNVFFSFAVVTYLLRE